MQSSYISGIAQGANVGKDQVIILGVTSGTSVTVNTQVYLQARALPILYHMRAAPRELSFLPLCAKGVSCKIGSVVCMQHFLLSLPPAAKVLL